MNKGHSETTYKMLNHPHSDEKLVIEQEDFFKLIYTTGKIGVNVITINPPLPVVESAHFLSGVTSCM